MLQTTRQGAVQAMRDNMRHYTARPSRAAYNTGSTLTVQDVSAFAYAYRLKIPGASLTSTGADAVLLTPIYRALTAQVTDQVPLSPADIVVLVRRVFGLNVSDAAKVFGVQRPAIYQWLDLQDMTTVRQVNQERMKQLYRLAIQSEKLGPLHIGALRAVLPGSGSTLLDLLSENHIDPVRLMETHQMLKAMDATFRAQEHKKTMAVIQGLKGAFSAMANNEPARKKG